MVWFLIWISGLVVMPTTLIALVYLRDNLRVSFKNETVEGFTYALASGILEDLENEDGWGKLTAISLFWPLSLLFGIVVGGAMLMAVGLKFSLKRFIRTKD